MDYQNILSSLHQQINTEPNPGKVAAYIPELDKVDPKYFGIGILTNQQEYFGEGDHEVSFSIQSCAKVFSLTMAYQHLDGELWKRVDVEPSGTPFNSLVQLEADKGIPRNPFINAGAIVVCDVLVSLFPNPKAALLDFVRDLSGDASIDYDQSVANSEAQTGFRNIALINFIRSFGNIHNNCNQVLDLYFNMCSLSMSCRQLAESCFYLANNGQNKNGKVILNRSKTKRVNAIMQTCGFYDEAGEFAYRVGLPGKSGVGGGIIAIHPEEYSMAVWSPPLNPKGNSYRGMRFLEAFTTRTNSSIF
ncbi:MAG: glutaminase [Saprospiraceae bacterium]